MKCSKCGQELPKPRKCVACGGTGIMVSYAGGSITGGVNKTCVVCHGKGVFKTVI